MTWHVKITDAIMSSKQAIASADILFTWCPNIIVSNRTIFKLRRRAYWPKRLGKFSSEREKKLLLTIKIVFSRRRRDPMKSLIEASFNLSLVIVWMKLSLSQWIISICRRCCHRRRHHCHVKSETIDYLTLTIRTKRVNWSKIAKLFEFIFFHFPVWQLWMWRCGYTFHEKGRFESNMQS